MFFTALVKMVKELFLNFSRSVGRGSLIFVRVMEGVFPNIVSNVLLSTILTTSVDATSDRLLTTSSTFSDSICGPIVEGNGTDSGRVV